MKKHIIIAGVPRAGKSTISQMIAKQWGYQHISMDSIIAGIEKTFPETGIDTHLDVDEQKNLELISSKISIFINNMMKSGEYDECDYGMVIDVYQLLPQHFIQNIDQEMCDIYYFITSNVTGEERFQLLKKYDTPNDYTYYYTDTQNREDCFDIVEVSKRIKEQCEQYNLPYYETAHNREAVFRDFLCLYSIDS